MHDFTLRQMDESIKERSLRDRWQSMLRGTAIETLEIEIKNTGHHTMGIINLRVPAFLTYVPNYHTSIEESLLSPMALTK